MADTDTSRAIKGSVTLEDRLDTIEALLRTLTDRIAEGNTQFATLNLRVRALEVIVYGACGLALLGIAGAIIALVVKA